MADAGVVMSDLVPGFLVAVPQLLDSTFHRTVILMLEHGETGALGLVINRPGKVSLAEVARLQSLKVRPEMEETRAFFGGPVQLERGFVLHEREEIEESVELFDGLRVSSSVETLKEMLEGPTDRFRLVLGYSGWQPGQLERELQEGSWLVAKADRRHVLETEPSKVWDAVLADMGVDPATLVMGSGLH